MLAQNQPGVKLAFLWAKYLWLNASDMLPSSRKPPISSNKKALPPLKR